MHPRKSTDTVKSTGVWSNLSTNFHLPRPPTIPRFFKKRSWVQFKLPQHDQIQTPRPSTDSYIPKQTQPYSKKFNCSHRVCDESTCTPSDPSDIFSDRDTDIIQFPITQNITPPLRSPTISSIFSNSTSSSIPHDGPSPDHVRQVLSASELSPSIHDALCDVLSSSVDPSRSCPTESLEDRRRSLSRSRYPSWFRSKLSANASSSHNFSNSGNSPFWRASSVSDADDNMDDESRSGRIFNNVRAAKHKLSRSELRKSLDVISEENSQLRNKVSKLVMDDVEMTTLRSRVAELEWALDIVRDDASRIRDEAISVLEEHNQKDSCHANDNNHYEDVGYVDTEHFDDGESTVDEWEIRSQMKMQSVVN